MAVVALVAPAAVADNPIIQTKFTADPAPLVFDGGVYLYTSHDEDDATGFTMFDWLLYTTTDMVNWTDHGVVGGVRAPTKTFAWADGSNAWAPQAIFRNGKFFLYCPLSGNGHMEIGVAVADTPEGPFRDAIGKPLINTSSTHDIDPTVWIDDDGQAYLYWGHQHSSYVKLNQDMISYSGSIVELPRPELYEEGPWFYRRDTHYYLAFASTCCPEGIGYAMSDSPTGPWTTKGHIVKPNPISSGNHPGIIDYKGTSYVFGFDYALNLAETSVHRERRSVNVGVMTYKADGTIAETAWWSKEGVMQVGTLNPYVRTEAETIAWSKGLKTERCDAGGMDVTSIENGDFIKVKGVDFGAGATSFDARVAPLAGGTIELRLDSQTGALVGSCSVSGAAGAKGWTTASCGVSGASGVHDLFMVFTGASGSLFNFDWWSFHSSAPPADAGSGGDAIDAGSGGDGDQGGVGGGNGGGGSGGGGTGSGGRGGGGGGGGGGGNSSGSGGGAHSGGVVGTLGCSFAAPEPAGDLAGLALLCGWALTARARRVRSGVTTQGRTRGAPNDLVGG